MKYIDKLIENCEVAQNANPTNTFVINKNLDNLKGVTNAIYIIEDESGDIDETYRAFAKYKKTKARKCPKLNNAPSKTLYVGSSTTDVRKRLEQHMGEGHKATYALQLKHWNGQRKVKISIQEYDVPRDVLQIIEDAISFDLSPAFGKTGSNGR